MRILFSSLGSHGHTYPLLPLAIAARELGHEITYVTAPAFADTLRPHGIEHVTGGLDMRTAFESVNAGLEARQARDFDPDRIAQVFGSVLPRRFAADLAPIIADRKPDLVVHEVGNPGAGLAAKVAGVPALCHGFGRIWRADELSDAARRHLGEVAADLGVDAPDDLTLGNPYLDICPPSVQDAAFLAGKADRIPLRPVPFAEPGELPRWVLDHDEPLVYLTLGTAFGRVDVLRAAVDGLAALDVKVLVAAGPAVEAEALGALPDNVVARQWVPQADVLPHVDLVVHHGGSGTTLGTYGVGVPQLLLPQGADQFSNAEVVVEAGLGDRLLGDDVTPEAVTAKARHLLADESVRAAARAIADEVAAMPSPQDVARTLPDRA
ncbi:glycosyltransferase [Actinosynnema sp. NPDC053489]|uniref:glycosyltransferase n=1 Tax=Actinosynnema sp. NPDC053489 TaxID=3363916 RepID=UPI0037C7FF76